MRLVGASLPTQRALRALLNPKAVVEQTVMLETLFSHKRDYTLRRLQDMGVEVRGWGGDRKRST